MKCPICKDELAEVGPGARRCPNGDGLLVSLKVLKEAHAYVVKTDTIAPPDAQDSSLLRVIHCPNCLSQMMVVDYAGLGIMIDACFSCPYRWLDTGEFIKIRDRSVHGGRLKPEQLMALEGLNSAMAQEVADGRVLEAVDD